MKEKMFLDWKEKGHETRQEEEMSSVQAAFQWVLDLAKWEGVENAELYGLGIHAMYEEVDGVPTWTFDRFNLANLVEPKKA